MRAPAPFSVDTRTLPRRADGGFTLTELMIVVAIIGVMSALAAPMFTRDNQTDAGRAFAHTVARELQKSRSEAVASRLNVRAHVYSDRVELRTFKAGATVGAVPVAPALTDPLLGVVRAKDGVVVLNVVAPTDTAPATEVLTTTKFVIIDFLSRGGSQLIGSPIPTSATIYVKNKNLPDNSEFGGFRVDVTAVTGFVSVRTR